MAKVNKYRDAIESGNIGSLRKIVNLDNFEIVEIPETDRIRIYMEFILEKVDSCEISVTSLIHEFCLLEKALGGEYGGKFILKNITKGRYISIASYDHYKVIIFHGLKKLGIEQDENKILNKDQLQELAKTIWH